MRFTHQWLYCALNAVVVKFADTRKDQYRDRVVQGLADGDTFFDLCFGLLVRLDFGSISGRSGLASHISAGRGGGGASRRRCASSAPRRSSSLTYALGRSLLGRRRQVPKGWYVLLEE